MRNVGGGPRYAPRRPPRPFFPPLRAASDALLRAAVRARISGSALILRALSRATRLRPSALHAFEQYRTVRFDMANFLPHSLQPMVTTLPYSLSALAVHRLQCTGRMPRPCGSMSRPHSAQARGFAAFALDLGIPAPRLARGGGGGGLSPRAPALRAAAHALMLASLMARFLGSAMRLR